MTRILSLLLLFTTLGCSAPSTKTNEPVPKPVWLWISDGQELKAVKHTPTGKCFVAFYRGGVIEVDPSVCNK